MSCLWHCEDKKVVILVIEAHRGLGVLRCRGQTLRRALSHAQISLLHLQCHLHTQGVCPTQKVFWACPQMLGDLSKHCPYTKLQENTGESQRSVPSQYYLYWS